MHSGKEIRVDWRTLKQSSNTRCEWAEGMWPPLHQFSLECFLLQPLMKCLDCSWEGSIQQGSFLFFPNCLVLKCIFLLLVCIHNIYSCVHYSCFKIFADLYLKILCFVLNFPPVSSRFLNIFLLKQLILSKII